MRYLQLLLLTALFALTYSCAHQSSTLEKGGYAYSNATATPDWYDPGAIDTLSVVTWNVEHFVDSHDNPYIENDRENSPPEDMEQRRRLLAEAIQELDADIIVFQEMESDSYLQAFAEKRFPDMGYQVFGALESADWYMNVVVMSRVPLGVFHSYATVTTPIIGQTDEQGNTESQAFINNRMWTADVLVSKDYRFTLSGLHLKAGGGARNEGWRLGQITLLRQHLKSLVNRDSDKNMVVTGDLNTTPGSTEFSRLLGDTAPRFVDPLAGTNAYSHPSDSPTRRIDHMLVNRNMTNELVPNSTNIVMPLNRDQMIKISDHLPVEAAFVTRDVSGEGK